MCAASNLNLNRMYPMNYSRPGLCVIFNNKYFKEKNYDRQGSEKDVMRLTEIFEDLRFEVETYFDQKSSDMRKIIREIAKRNFSEDSCFICFIMSHGNRGNAITTADLNQVYLNEFVDPFKANDTLKNKPKLFFVQTCRGNNEMNNYDNDQMDGEVYETDSSRVPIEADFLYAVFAAAAADEPPLYSTAVYSECYCYSNSEGHLR